MHILVRSPDLLGHGIYYSSSCQLIETNEPIVFCEFVFDEFCDKRSVVKGFKKKVDERLKCFYFTVYWFVEFNKAYVFCRSEHKDVNEFFEHIGIIEKEI
jgi:hypothetical protein